MPGPGLACCVHSDVHVGPMEGKGKVTVTLADPLSGVYGKSTLEEWEERELALAAQGDKS